MTKEVKCVICERIIIVQRKKYHSGATESFSEDGIMYKVEDNNSTGQGCKWFCNTCWEDLQE